MLSIVATRQTQISPLLPYIPYMVIVATRQTQRSLLLPYIPYMVIVARRYEKDTNGITPVAHASYTRAEDDKVIPLSNSCD